MTIRVIFWGNSASMFSARYFAALQESSGELVGVVDVPPSHRKTTNPLPAGLPEFPEAARQRGIAAFEPENPNKTEFSARLAALAPDLFLAVGYALILKPQVLAIPRLLAANFHASLLPEYRGKHPVFWALRNGEKYAGLTVHAMDRGIDTGDLIYQIRVRTRRDDSVTDLYERIMASSLPLVDRLIRDAADGSIPRQPQAEGAGAYYSGTSEQDFQFSWDWSAEKIRRYITATPGKCFIEIQGQRVTFLNAERERAAGGAAPGVLIRVGRSRAAVTANPGVISSSRVQVEQGEPESFANYCCRRKFILGERLSPEGKPR
jgi:methionyl-tRNA formyltransferase